MLYDINLRKVIINYRLLIVFSVLFLVSCDSTSPLIEHFEPAGDYILKYTDLPLLEKNKEVHLGGFNGLHYKGGRIFYTITSRGPVLSKNNQISLVVPDFTPEIIELTLQDDNSISITNRIQIKAPGGSLTSGKIPLERSVYGEVLIDSQGDDYWGINPGGIHYDRKNNFFWFGETYQPGLFQATMDGEIVKRLRPDEGLRRVFRSAYNHGGIRGIDSDNQDRLISIFNHGLENRAMGDDTSSIDYSIRRISRVDYTKNKSTNPEAEISMFYKVEPESFDGIPVSQVNTGDITFIDDSTYLVAEYADFGGETRSLLYIVRNTVATKAIESQEGLLGKTFETLLPDEIAKDEVDFVPVKKTLFSNLKAIGITYPSGMALIDKNNLAIIQNNKFGLKNTDPVSKTFEFDKSDIKISIIDISEIYKTEK